MGCRRSSLLRPVSCLLLVCHAYLSAAAVEADKRPLRVAIYADEGVTRKDPERVSACLPKSDGFRVRMVTAKEIQQGSLADYDVLIHPGGSGSGQSKSLGDEGRRQVRKFVQEGGGFIGICAGAYLASAEYPWALKLLDATVVDDEHWARGTGDVKIHLPENGRAALGSSNGGTTMYYENGPLLGPAKNAEIPDFESLAEFASEIRENDAPEGVMRGTTAIARGQFGNGRVVCFSPHPERSRGCEAQVVAAVRWAAEKRQRPASSR